MHLFLLLISTVARIALVKPEKARGVEDVILRAAQMGQIVEKVKNPVTVSLLQFIIPYMSSSFYSVWLTLHECYTSKRFFFFVFNRFLRSGL